MPFSNAASGSVEIMREALVERAVEQREHPKMTSALTDFRARDVEDVARQQVLQFFLAARDPAQQQDHRRRGDDEGDTDDRLLRYLAAFPRRATS